jgi:hypothetical protein
MHLEILVEGQTERTALEPLLTKMLGPYKQPHTWRIHKHRGLGRLPDNPATKPNPKDPTLLHNLPSKLRAYSKSLKDTEAVVVLLDLDDRPDCKVFKQSLKALLIDCNPDMKSLIRIAIEELEAWYFGDQAALEGAYPNANRAVLAGYVQDSQCGTWEKLADAVYPGGHSALKRQGEMQCLIQKRVWARDIAPEMDIENNSSPSFQQFRDGLRNLVSPQLSKTEGSDPSTDRLNQSLME